MAEAKASQVCHVFVYGTLRRGEDNDITRLLPPPRFIGVARIAGTMYDLGFKFHCFQGGGEVLVVVIPGEIGGAVGNLDSAISDISTRTHQASDQAREAGRIEGDRVTVAPKFAGRVVEILDTKDGPNPACDKCKGKLKDNTEFVSRGPQLVDSALLGDAVTGGSLSLLRDRCGSFRTVEKAMTALKTSRAWRFSPPSTLGFPASRFWRTTSGPVSRPACHCGRSRSHVPCLVRWPRPALRATTWLAAC